MHKGSLTFLISGGLVVPRNDAPALALGRLLDDEAWSRKLGRRTRCPVETSFSLGAQSKQLRAFLFDGQPEN